MKSLLTRGLLLVLVVLTSIAGTAGAQEVDDSYQIEIKTVTGVFDAEGNQVGMVAVGIDDSNVGVALMVQGLPAGSHGLHLHETGNCDPAGEKTFELAGGHFNPGDMTHPHHAGDLGNLVVDDTGNALFLGELGALTYDDGTWGLADADGTALVIHADIDDLATDPSGNSGARIACAVLAPPAT